MRTSLFLVLFLSSSLFAAAKTSVTEEVARVSTNAKLEDMDNEEHIYSIQSRYSSLKGRFELGVQGTHGFNPGGFVNSDEIGGRIHYYLSDRFFLSACGTNTYTKLNDSGDKLWKSEGIFPDISQVKYRADLLVGYHLFYGKFRVSMDNVFYFDQYLALGPGLVGTTNGLSDFTKPAAVGELGLVLWFGRHFSTRLSVTDYYFQETRRFSKESVNHVLGSVSLGYVI